MLVRRRMAVALAAFGVMLLMPHRAIAVATSTTTSAPSESAVTLGDSVADAATVTGDGLIAPTGTVSFSVCGPSASVTGCATGGTPVGQPVTVSAGVIGTATATSTATSAAFTPTATGTWCFRADYSGDTLYAASSDGSAGECFSVGQASSSTGSVPQASSVALGAHNTDSATVTGSSVGGSPTGTVSFFVCGPLAAAFGCGSGGEAVGTPVELTAGAGNTATATSPGFTPSAPGTWCFRAEYGGDANYGTSSDGSSAECFSVGQAASSTGSVPQSSSVTLGAQNADSATVTGNAAGGSPTGTVTFFACGPLTGASGCPSGGTSIGSSALGNNGTGTTATAMSPAFTPTAAGTWCFRADYGGDANYGGSSDGSGAGCFAVGKAAPSVTSNATTPMVTLTASTSDQVVVSANSAGGSPTGIVSFYACGPLAAASGCGSGGRAVGTPVALTAGTGNTATATSSTFTPGSAGVWCFRAEYSGDSNYTSASDGSSGECFTVPQPGAPTPRIDSPEANARYAVGQDARASYTCADAGNGPGIASCTGTVPNGASLDTAAHGVHTFSVTAQSQDGLTTTAFASYTVAAPPTISIASPQDGATYTRGQPVGASFTCTEDQFGPGLVDCSGSSSAATAKTGTFPFTVKAASSDGQSTSRVVHYTVVLPSNRFTVSGIRGHRDGRFTFVLVVQRAGQINVVATAPRSTLPRPAAGRFVFARLHLTPRTPGRLRVTVAPDLMGRRVVKHHRGTVMIQLAVTYTPAWGTPRRAIFNGVRVTP